MDGLTMTQIHQANNVRGPLLSIPGKPLHSPQWKPGVAPSGRKCAHGYCTTILSRWNPQAVCGPHASQLTLSGIRC